MLMNPTLTNNFHPTFAGMGQDGIRHDLNRLYYNAEFLRSDLIDGTTLAPSYPMGTYGYAPYVPFAQSIAPYGLVPQLAAGYPYATQAITPWGYRPYDVRFGDVRPWETRSFDPRFETRYDLRLYDPRLSQYDPRLSQVRPIETAVRPYDAMMSAAPSPDSGYTHVPATNWAEAPDAYLLVVELPGVDLKDINLQILGSSLVLNAYRRPTWSNGSVTVNYHFTEGRFGTLRRHLPLPVGVLPGQIQANFVNGLLTILIPKSAASANQVPQASIVINSAVPTTM